MRTIARTSRSSLLNALAHALVEIGARRGNDARIGVKDSRVDVSNAAPIVDGNHSGPQRTEQTRRKSSLLGNHSIPIGSTEPKEKRAFFPGPNHRCSRGRLKG